jgi:hypothetical protein
MTKASSSAKLAIFEGDGTPSARTYDDRPAAFKAASQRAATLAARRTRPAAATMTPQRAAPAARWIWWCRFVSARGTLTTAPTPAAGS